MHSHTSCEQSAIASNFGPWHMDCQKSMSLKQVSIAIRKKTHFSGRDYTFSGNSAAMAVAQCRWRCFPTLPLHVMPLLSNKAGVCRDPEEATTTRALTVILMAGLSTALNTTPPALFSFRLVGVGSVMMLFAKTPASVKMHILRR